MRGLTDFMLERVIPEALDERESSSSYIQIAVWSQVASSIVFIAVLVYIWTRFSSRY